MAIFCGEILKPLWKILPINKQNEYYLWDIFVNFREYCEDEEVCKKEFLKWWNFQIPFSFPPKMGFEEWRKFDGTCNYQNCNLWSNPVIHIAARIDFKRGLHFCLWCSIIMHSWLKAKTICFSSNVCLRASGFKNI